MARPDSLQEALDQGPELPHEGAIPEDVMENKLHEVHVEWQIMKDAMNNEKLKTRAMEAALEEARRHELEKLCKVELFTCPACTPHMLAVSVDGNRKLYRFKNTASRVIRGPTLDSSSSNWARSSLKYRWNLSPSSRSSCTSL
ncbi:hypothetical protein AAFF_G00147800 [Aldrovandia affinis]|uniref:Uncharacterized protein n=1 Tax=Aldrovandia affinis TaxID=143900 RepID=A0AAD7W9N1_9TELE|nr:hypothetical protein AAFF_G00147800 [Aldrovandia affinis]